MTPHIFWLSCCFFSGFFYTHQTSPTSQLLKSWGYWMYGAPATQETWCNLRSIHKWGDQDCDDVSAQLATFGGIMAATLTWLGKKKRMVLLMMVLLLLLLLLLLFTVGSIDGLLFWRQMVCIDLHGFSGRSFVLKTTNGRWSHQLLTSCWWKTSG